MRTRGEIIFGSNDAGSWQRPCDGVPPHPARCRDARPDWLALGGRPPPTPRSRAVLEVRAQTRRFRGADWWWLHRAPAKQLRKSLFTSGRRLVAWRVGRTADGHPDPDLL